MTMETRLLAGVFSGLDDDMLNALKNGMGMLLSNIESMLEKGQEGSR